MVLPRPVRTLALLLFLLAPWVAGGVIQEGLLPPPINAMCPVMPEEPVDPEYTVLHEGQAIGLCCATCRRKFLRDPESYLPLVAEYRAAPAGAEDEAPRAAAPAAESPPRWLRATGSLHPLLVHFPIALLLAGALAAWIDLLRRSSGLRTASLFCLGLGALGGVLAAASGLAAAAGSRWPGELEGILERHRLAGIVTALLGLAAFALARAQASRGAAAGPGARPLHWLLLACALAVGITGYLGACLVHGPDHLRF